MVWNVLRHIAPVSQWSSVALFFESRDQGHLPPQPPRPFMGTAVLGPKGRWSWLYKSGGFSQPRIVSYKFLRNNYSKQLQATKIY